MTDTKTVSVGVLCIQGAFIEHIKMLQKISASIYEAHGFTVKVVDVRKPDQLPGLNGLIIPGGESTTLSIFLKKNNFEEALKSWVFDEKRPGVVWGTCAGLILLSDEVAGQKQGGQATIGGLHIECSRNIYGRQISSFESKVKLHLPVLHDKKELSDTSVVADAHPSLLTTPLPPSPQTISPSTPSRDTSLDQDECHGVFIRAPGVVKVNSPTVKVLATLRDEENSIVAVQQDNLIATCFHPELTDDARWHMYFVEQVIARSHPIM